MGGNIVCFWDIDKFFWFFCLEMEFAAFEIDAGGNLLSVVNSISVGLCAGRKD